MIRILLSLSALRYSMRWSWQRQLSWITKIITHLKESLSVAFRKRESQLQKADAKSSYRWCEVLWTLKKPLYHSPSHYIKSVYVLRRIHIHRSPAGAAFKQDVPANGRDTRSDGLMGSQAGKGNEMKYKMRPPCTGNKKHWNPCCSLCWKPWVPTISRC